LTNWRFDWPVRLVICLVSCGFETPSRSLVVCYCPRTFTLIAQYWLFPKTYSSCFI